MNSAGKSTRQGQERHHLRRMIMALSILLVGIVFLMLLSGLLGFRHKPIVFLGFFAALFLTLKIVVYFLQSIGLKEKRIEGKYERGAIAEESIGALLEQLPGENLVLHDVRSNFGNIDHIVISRKKGVILIETKSHHGKVTMASDSLLINGKPTEKDFIKQTLGNCYWLKESIKSKTGMDVWINSVIVFTNAFVTIRGRIKGVSIINSKFLPEYYARLPDNKNAAALWEKRGAVKLMETAS